jgi:hypothetical protein
VSAAAESPNVPLPLPPPQEALVAYCRAALRLGLLQELGPLAVEEVQQVVMNELTAEDFSWCAAGWRLSRQEHGECAA